MQGRSNKTGAVAGILLPMGLICLFAFCSLALALMGGRAYKQIQGGIDDSFGSTVAASYLRTKLSQNNRSGAVSIRQEGDCDVLVLASEDEGGAHYETRIFLTENTLREAFVPADTPFSPASGVLIAQVKDCRFTIADDNLFTADIRSMGNDAIRVAFLLAGEGGAA